MRSSKVVARGTAVILWLFGNSIESTSASRASRNRNDRHRFRATIAYGVWVLKEDWAHRQGSRNLHYASSKHRILSQTFLSTNSALPSRSCSPNSPKRAPERTPMARTPEYPTLYGRRNKCGLSTQIHNTTGVVRLAIVVAVTGKGHTNE